MNFNQAVLCIILLKHLYWQTYFFYGRIALRQVRNKKNDLTVPVFSRKKYIITSSCF